MADYFVRYKLWGDYQLRFAFSKEVKESLRKWKGYTVVPIPVSDHRYQERGFNQVEGFLEAAGITYYPLLKKAEVEHQIGKGRRKRLEMEQVFELKQSLKVSKGVLLVDDVYTTGATLAQAKKIIYENISQNVFTFSIAR
ncbi:MULTISPECIES: ComF family protein [unclassified Streptococcus]|uniref:ComF family protein n=1 Tax=unclassified Streptococcus TaxID=2608887 RepID=UPI0018AAC3A4|nr:MULTISPECIES: ComF family protein [unclassified Streptococcus]MBF8970065.1 ComF family protein [Streptococcus sp. NLN76]MBG9367753.1 ComF family protein [Streptococcus sp. NLN64]